MITGDDLPPPGEVAAGINRIEGYLLAETEHAHARTEAEAFADLMPWLLTSQREQVVQHYTRARLEVSRHQLRTVTSRIGQLRQEYEQRYHALRTRLLRRCAVLASSALATTALTVAGLLAARAHGG
jgi:hypothetical protein